MAYTKQTWNNGDVISADKLNHIEDGVFNSNVTIIHCSVSQDSSSKLSDATADMSYEEAKSRMQKGESIVIELTVNINYVQPDGGHLLALKGYSFAYISTVTPSTSYLPETIGADVTFGQNSSYHVTISQLGNVTITK